VERVVGWRIDSFKDLIVWQKAMDLAESSYRLTTYLPREETYGLAIQIRRAAISIPSNIAEGQQRHGPREFLHFLSIVLGSLAELETQLLLTVRLQYLAKADVEPAIELIYECQRIVHSIRNRLLTRNGRSAAG
jgi:four helix bundle protein